ncbi:hypothetical protein [Streptomyces sp. NBC_01022]|uniref:hypothetical protein n=1 Tax=Streptomyces sp. NBC_01022 TaxID=2903723 RepID=UPI002DDC1C9F|nr:hypothetical protein [Streptomyces sp. NBC_01022]WRZ84850.1 hypothetical protein OG316_33610 [Streptomyces sp. NBC_01022]
MATSAVPAAVDALLAILRASPALAEVRIVDGPPSVNLTDRHRIYVGWAPGSEQAVDITQEFASAGARTRDEDFSIACYAETRTGDKDMSLRRAKAFELLAAVEDALRATNDAPTAPTLSGTVLWSHLTAGSLVQEQNDSGALAGLPFSVTCHARI